MATRQPFEPESAQSAEFFRKLASGVPGILFTYWLSADGSSHYYPYVSDQVRTLFGVEPETLKESADAVFSVIHPDDAADVGDSILESARTLNAVRHAGLTFDHLSIPVTVSAGIADAHESKQPPASPDVLIGRADHRLYLAKQAGRDCAVGASGILRI